MADELNGVQNEANLVTFTVTDKDDGSAVDVSSATITFWVKRQLDETTSGYLAQIEDGDFNKNVGGESNVVSAIIPAANNNWAGQAHGIVKFVIDADNTKKGVFRMHNTASPE